MFPLLLRRAPRPRRVWSSTPPRREAGQLPGQQAETQVTPSHQLGMNNLGNPLCRASLEALRLLAHGPSLSVSWRHSGLVYLGVTCSLVAWAASRWPSRHGRGHQPGARASHAWVEKSKTGQRPVNLTIHQIQTYLQGSCFATASRNTEGLEFQFAKIEQAC